MRITNTYDESTERAAIMHYFKNLELERMSDEELTEVRTIATSMQNQAFSVLAGRRAREFKECMEEIDSPLIERDSD